MEWRVPASHDGFRMIRVHQIKWHDKFSSSLACLFFFFIGAPLGAIIRKGGLGVSTIVSVLIFIIYYIIGVSGMKMARDGTWNISYGMWISTFIMTPLGVFLTYKSNKDSTVFNLDNYKAPLLFMLGFRPKRNLQAKEVIIDTPDYGAVATRLGELNEQFKELNATLRRGMIPNYFRTFFRPRPQNVLTDIMQQQEKEIEILSNSDNRKLVYKLNDYPIPYRHSHLLPSSNRTINATLGLLLPLGLILWLRIIYYRRILRKDIQQILATNNEIISRIADLDQEAATTQH